MTTHYMEEADKLCDRIAIVDRGELLELDTPEALKQRAPGGTLVEITLSGDASQRRRARARARRRAARRGARGRLLRVYSDRGGRIISPRHRGRRRRRRVGDEHQPHEPSLETLFVARTGRKLD